MLRLTVGVNHRIFHVYHFWNFLIFKYTWVCSSISSKNKNIFLNLSIKYWFENEYLPEYFKNVFIFILVGKSSLHAYKNAKRTNAVSDAALSAIYSSNDSNQRNALDLWTGALTLATSWLLWKQQWNSWHLLRNNEHIFPDFMDIAVWIWMKLMPKLTLYFVHNVCKWQKFSCFHTAVEAIFILFCDHFWTKTLFSTSSFWGSNSHFLDDLDYLLCNVGVSFWFYPIEIGIFSFFPNFDLKSRIWPVICLSQVWNVKIFKNRSKFKKVKIPILDNFIIFENQWEPFFSI